MKQANNRKTRKNKKRPQRAQPQPYAGPRLGFTVNECVQSGAFSSRNKFYNGVARGELRTYLDGKRRMTTAEAIREYQALRERVTAEGEAAEATAQALISAGQIDDAEGHLERINDLFKTAKSVETLGLSSIAKAAEQGAKGLEKQLQDLKLEINALKEKALSELKIGASQDSLKALLQSIRKAIEKEQFSLKLSAQIGGASVPGFAAGGVASGLAMVGERGPELVQFLQPARVYSNPDTKRILSEIGGMRVPALASGGVVIPGAASSSTVVTHDIRFNGRQVARVMGEREQLYSLVNALAVVGRGT
jgi:tetratricopeptide (TPR) repeat protein